MNKKLQTVQGFNMIDINKKIGFLITVSLIAASFMSPGMVLPAGKPDIYVREQTFDFGTINKGVVRFEFDFKIENRGEEVLKISSIKTSCGCTTPNKTKFEIGPGKSELLRIKFDTKSRRGKQHKKVTIFSNDPDKSMFALDIIGVIN